MWARRQYDPRVRTDQPVGRRQSRRRRVTWIIVVLSIAVAIAVAGAPAAVAPAGSVAVIVVPRFAPAAYADRGAVGLFVPGAGSTVSRERALASLVRAASSRHSSASTASPG